MHLRNLNQRLQSFVDTLELTGRVSALQMPARVAWTYRSHVRTSHQNCGYPIRWSTVLDTEPGLRVGPSDCSGVPHADLFFCPWARGLAVPELEEASGDIKV